MTQSLQKRFNNTAGQWRKSCDLTVFITDDLQGHRGRIGDAVRLLSQSPTGRALMQTAIDNDFGVILQANPDMSGYMDSTNKLVFLDRAAAVPEMALRLAHELAHVSQFCSGITINALRDAPPATMARFMAIEADARAYEMRVAIELAAPEKGYAAFPHMLREVAEKSGNPLVKALVIATDPQTCDRDKTMAAAFKAFYGYAKFRMFYEGLVLDRLESVDRDVLDNPFVCTGNVSGEDLKKQVNGHGMSYSISYLPAGGAVIDLDDDIYRSISVQAQERLEKLFGGRWNVPVYFTAKNMPADAAGRAPQKKPGGQTP